MTEEDLRHAILKVLADVVPEMDPAALAPEINFRDQFDFDSVDFLNFALGLSESLGIAIPEAELPRLSSLRGCLSYLGPKVA